MKLYTDPSEHLTNEQITDLIKLNSAVFLASAYCAHSQLFSPREIGKIQSFENANHQNFYQNPDNFIITKE